MSEEWSRGRRWIFSGVFVLLLEQGSARATPNRTKSVHSNSKVIQNTTSMVPRKGVDGTANGSKTPYFIAAGAVVVAVFVAVLIWFLIRRRRKKKKVLRHMILGIRCLPESESASNSLPDVRSAENTTAPNSSKTPLKPTKSNSNTGPTMTKSNSSTDIPCGRTQDKDGVRKELKKNMKQTKNENPTKLSRTSASGEGDKKKNAQKNPPKPVKSSDSAGSGEAHPKAKSVVRARKSIPSAFPQSTQVRLPKAKFGCHEEELRIMEEALELTTETSDKKNRSRTRRSSVNSTSKGTTTKSIKKEKHTRRPKQSETGEVDVEQNETADPEKTQTIRQRSKASATSAANQDGGSKIQTPAVTKGEKLRKPKTPKTPKTPVSQQSCTGADSSAM